MVVSFLGVEVLRVPGGEETVVVLFTCQDRACLASLGELSLNGVYPVASGHASFYNFPFGKYNVCQFMQLMLWRVGSKTKQK